MGDDTKQKCIDYSIAGERVILVVFFLKWRTNTARVPCRESMAKIKFTGVDDASAGPLQELWLDR